MTARRKFLKGAGMAGILAAGSAPALVSAGESIRWRLASSFPPSLDALYGTAKRFADNVRKASRGRFEISVYHAGALVPAFGVADAVEEGTVECAHTAPYYFFGKNEAFAFDCAIPFGMNSRQLTAWMYDGNGLDLMREFYAHYNIVNFPMGNTGAQMGGWYRNEINSVEDLDGLRIRIGGFGGRVLEKLGVISQNLPAGEVYQALERRTIDAVEFVGPYDDLSLGLHKVAPYYYYPAWWEGGAQLSLYINNEAYQSLSDHDKDIVRQAASDAHVWMQARYDAQNPRAMRQLVAEGARLSRLPREVMDAAFQASREVYDELNESNPRWRRIYEDYAGFLAEQYQWFSLAENNYNQYMAARRRDL